MGLPDNGAPRDAALKNDPFPTDALPPEAADMARAIAAATLTPESLTGPCVLGIASACLGKGLEVKSGPDRRTRGNLYLNGIAPSGTGKSESMRHISAPLYEHEAELVHHHQNSERPHLAGRREFAEARLARLKRDAAKNNDPAREAEIVAEMVELKRQVADIEAKLLAPALVVEDATVEAQAEALARNDECIASISAEPGEVLSNVLGRHNKTDRPDDTMYLKAYSGDPYRQDRIGRGRQSLESPCMTILWLMQPEKFRALLASGAVANGGLIQRMCSFDTGVVPQRMPDQVPAIPDDVKVSYRALLRSLLTRFRMSERPVVIECEPEATTALREHFNAVVDRRNGDLKQFSTFAARWTEWEWKMALVVHALRLGEAAGGEPLSLEDARAGIKLADWFSRRQLELLAAGRLVSFGEKWRRLQGLLGGQLGVVTARGVQRRRVEPTAEAARLLLEECVSRGLLEKATKKPESGGWPQEQYRLPVSPVDGASVTSVTGVTDD